ncbi:exonuclease domain-containing protein [Actinoplanes sp. NPDC049681]|uniref:exonuclease domain-containing protein n=1 Tax=Actinoplanes sp. NPDC049681 TaxID=3363905 RepID=UPI003791530E
MTSWVAIDFETANEHRGSPCSVALVAVENNKIVQSFTTHIQPPPTLAYFSPFNTFLHGITAEDVCSAPSWAEALDQIIDFIDGRTVVAHNASFDMGVIRSACDQMGVRWPDLAYACTMVIARRTWSLLSYSLPWVAEAAEHELLDHHDATADAAAAAAIAIAAQQLHDTPTLADLLHRLGVRFGELTGERWSGCRLIQASRPRPALPGANPRADPDGPLYGLTICLTGTLTSMTRDTAHALVAEAGGQPVPGVSKKTNILVIGEQDPRRFTPGAAMSSKHQKAAALLSSGHPIEVIAEPDFLQRLAATEGVDLTVGRH